MTDILHEIEKEVFHVYVDNPVDIRRPGPKERVTTFSTYIATAQPQLILPHNPARISAQVVVVGAVPANQNVLLGMSTGDVSTALAATGDTYQGAGMTLPPSNVPVPIDGTTEAWMAGIGAGTPPLVSVIQVIEKN